VDGPADHARVAAEIALPETVAENDDAASSWHLRLLRQKRAAENRLTAEG
jgi:hypothetical protein